MKYFFYEKSTNCNDNIVLRHIYLKKIKGDKLYLSDLKKELNEKRVNLSCKFYMKETENQDYEIVISKYEELKKIDLEIPKEIIEELEEEVFFFCLEIIILSQKGIGVKNIDKIYHFNFKEFFEEKDLGRFFEYYYGEQNFLFLRIKEHLFEVEKKFEVEKVKNIQNLTKEQLYQYFLFCLEKNKRFLGYRIKKTNNGYFLFKNNKSIIIQCDKEQRILIEHLFNLRNEDYL